MKRKQDLERARRGIEEFLRGLGFDIDADPELTRTAERVVGAFSQDLLSGENMDDATMLLKGSSPARPGEKGIVVLRNLSTVTVCPHHLMPAIGHATVMYIPDKALGKTNRISFPSHFSKNAAPAGCSSVLAEITHQPGDEISSMTDAELISEVTGMLEQMGICTRERIVYTSVQRQPFAYVVYDLAYQKNSATIRKFCSSAGIPLVGRFAEFEYLNMDGVIRSVFDFVARNYPS